MNYEPRIGYKITILSLNKKMCVLKGKINYLRFVYL